MVRSNSKNSQRSHWLLFLYLVVFIAISGSLLGLLSSYFHNKAADTSAPDKAVVAAENKQQTLVQEQSEPEASVSISKNPLLHVRQQQLKIYFNQAVAMLHAKKYELSIVALHKVLEIDPKMPEAHINMGFSLLGLKKPKAARDFFLTALELDDTQLNAFYGLALSYAELTEYQSAIGAIVSYIHLSPSNEPYIDIAHKKLRAWRQVVSEQEQKPTLSEG